MLAFSEEILVTKSDLDEKTAQMSDLTNKVEEMRTHHGYQVHTHTLTHTHTHTHTHTRRCAPTMGIRYLDEFRMITWCTSVEEVCSKLACGWLPLQQPHVYISGVYPCNPRNDGMLTALALRERGRMGGSERASGAYEEKARRRRLV